MFGGLHVKMAPGICSASDSLALDDWKKLAVLEW